MCYIVSISQQPAQEVNNEEDGASSVSLPTNCYNLNLPQIFETSYGPGGTYNNEVSN